MERFVVPLSLSLVEKHLLLNGWTLKDAYCPETRRVMTRAFRGDRPEILEYPKPTHLYDDLDPARETGRLLTALAVLEGRSPRELTADMLAAFGRPPDGFRCRVCGDCCRRFRDAYQGLVSAEEVAAWEAAGLHRILRLVSRERRDGYAIHRAWVNPKTGVYFKKCPWLRRDAAAGGLVCGIHEYKPLKCRAFPLTRPIGEYSGCRGFEEGPEPFPAAPRVPDPPLENPVPARIPGGGADRAPRRAA